MGTTWGHWKNLPKVIMRGTLQLSSIRSIGTDFEAFVSGNYLCSSRYSNETSPCTPRCPRERWKPWRYRVPCPARPLCLLARVPKKVGCALDESNADAQMELLTDDDDNDDDDECDADGDDDIDKRRMPTRRSTIRLVTMTGQ